MLLGKLEVKTYTFTAIGNSEKEVASAILNAWKKLCEVEKKYKSHFPDDTSVKKSIHYLDMEVGIAYQLYNNVPPKDPIKGMLVEDKSETKIKKQVIKQMIDGLLDQMMD